MNYKTDEHSIVLPVVEYVLPITKKNPNPSGYIEVVDNSCTVEEPQMSLLSDGEDFGEDYSVFRFSDNGNKLGKLSPTGSIHFIDKFDLSTLLKDPDNDLKINGMPFDPSKLKCRYGMLKCVKQPMYTIALTTRIGWMSNINFKDCFGFDYENDLPTIKQRNITKLVYPVAGSKELYRWGREKHYRHTSSHVIEQKIIAKPKINYLKHPLYEATKVKAGKNIKPYSRTWIRCSPDDIHEYGQKAVKSSYSPMYRIWSKLGYPMN